MTTIHHHHHYHDPADIVMGKLDEIRALLNRLLQQGSHMRTELETLKDQVAKTTTVEQSAITLLNGLSAQIAALKGDPAALQTLADQLAAQSTDLAAAVAANTPA